MGQQCSRPRSTHCLPSGCPYGKDRTLASSLTPATEWLSGPPCPSLGAQALGAAPLRASPPFHPKVPGWANALFFDFVAFDFHFFLGYIPD